MKKLYFLIVFIGIQYAGSSQTINIPDAIFKARLLTDTHIASDPEGEDYGYSIDTNNDGEIQVDEALAVTGIGVNIFITDDTEPIESVEGIQYFTNLKQLSLIGNSLTTLDVTMLPNLTTLLCIDNDITQLSVSNLSNLRYLEADNNMLGSINISGLTALELLTVGNNLIETVDLSENPQLKDLIISNNPLTEIDFTNTPQLRSIEIANTLIETLDCSPTMINYAVCNDNPNLTSINLNNGVISNSDPDLLYFAFTFDNLPSLQSICLDEGEQGNLVYTDYNNSGEVDLFTGELCDIPLVLSTDEITVSDVQLYPNPFANYVVINTNEITDAEIFDVTGKRIAAPQFSNEGTITTIDLQSITQPGIYILKLTTTGNGTMIKRIIKE